MPENHPTVANTPDAFEQFIWDWVSLTPIRSLWDLQGIPVRVIAQRTWTAAWNDDLFGSAAELSYWFLFALFPMLVSASSLVGIALHQASNGYDRLLHYLSPLIPPSAYGFVVQTFNEIVNASNRQKLTVVLVALWAASAGFSAIQDAMNAVYKVKETRPYWKVRGAAVLISPILSLLFTAILAILLATDLFSHRVHHHIAHHLIADPLALVVRIVGWAVATALLALLFALIYYWAPDVKHRQWRWFTPGGAIGILGWMAASFGLRVYLHFFNGYSATYGSLGAVLILLTWFYLSGFMLLLGGEVNSEIEAAATEKRLNDPASLALIP
ncbi:MAG TPA: YihY/virulence factor BrkB family protein [Acidobacteriaceae bacterium]